MTRGRNTHAIVDTLILTLAVLVRLLAVGVLQSHTVARSTYEHGAIAANLLAGRGFSIAFLGADGPTSQQAPAYPLLVAAAYALGGVETPRALLMLFVAQAFLGGLLAWGTIRLARALLPGSPWAAWLAGLIVACYPTLVYSATHVQVAGLASVLLVGSLVAAVRLGRTAAAWDAAALGVLSGLLALTDPILVVCGPGVAWLAWRESRDFRRVSRSLGLAGLVVVLMVAPWVIRNARVHGQFVPIKSTFGYAFWQGNCSLSAGTDKVVRASVDRVLAERLGSGSLASWNAALWAARHEAGYIDDIALSRADRRALGALPEPERSRVLFQRALADLRAEPARYPLLCLARLQSFVFFDETNPKTRHPLYRATHLAFTLLAFVSGFVVDRRTRSALAPLFLVFALVALFHTLTIVSARFHIPIEPLMAIGCGAGLAAMSGAVAAIRERRRASTAPAHGVVRVGVELHLSGGQAAVG